VGWRWLFAASIVPVAALSLARGRALAADRSGSVPGLARGTGRQAGPPEPPAVGFIEAIARNLPAFARCLALAGLTIASGTMNVFYAKDLPQSPYYTALFWGAVVPGMLLGVRLVRRFGVGRTLEIYASILVVLSLACWLTDWPGRKLAFALGLAAVNGIPFGLMGAYFNEVFRDYRTMLSGSAYNLGRILAGFAPVLLTKLGLDAGGNYFLFTAALGAGVLVIGARTAVRSRQAAA
jgi:putative MFS transporter